MQRGQVERYCSGAVVHVGGDGGLDWTSGSGDLREVDGLRMLWR